MTEQDVAVENDVPVQEARGRGRPAKYPLEELEVGDSFFVPKRAAAKVSMTARAKKLGITVAKRTVVENGVTGTRVWRTS